MRMMLSVLKPTTKLNATTNGVRDEGILRYDSASASSLRLLGLLLPHQHRSFPISPLLNKANISSFLFLLSRTEERGNLRQAHPTPIIFLSVCQSNSSMAKEIRKLNSWIEVAPAPVIFPTKPSNSPALETIAEEAGPEYDDEDQL
ncbi:hypothetical protein L6164_033670 [Bauhinia variegata]|uniref:Uncharacterized protein n=1 Tax=Bauhinia variegata TaxID=167791 RepID=A0ACB9KSU1_BAUVA|nr:hypothetical protein L6164_033670 [Bauhinia variegata]